VDDLIYFDNNATTPIDPRVVEAMMPYLRQLYGNAASSHFFGSTIAKAVREARDKVAELLGADTSEIIFTSGATEAINLAIKGLALHPSNRKNHIITCKSEHKAVLDTCKTLEHVGFSVTYLDVDHLGIINIDALTQAIDEQTFLIAIMLANNETGVIQDIASISRIAKSRQVQFFTDATQAAGKIPIDVDDLGVDLLTISAHKMYGPKGVGALFVRRGIELSAIIHGGGHEGQLRSGTLNVPGIVALGEACKILKDEMATNKSQIVSLRTKMESQLLKVPNAFLNGHVAKRLYNTTNICFPGAVISERLLNNPRIAVSNGSACSSALVEPSHVLVAMGRNAAEANCSIRFSIGKANTDAELESLLRFVFR
jgi:cysteine desulfurase